MIGLILSWLDERVANVVVAGKKSRDYVLSNMVFQGIVLGPILWNVFFSDAAIPIRLAKYMEIVFADDLNAYRMFGNATPNVNILRTARNCQEKLHCWGRANRITFDEAKESTTIICRQCPYGEPFKMYGIIFDPGLYMEEAVDRLCTGN